MRTSLRGHNALAFIPGVEEAEGEREEEKEEEGKRKKEKEARKGGLGKGIDKLEEGHLHTLEAIPLLQLRSISKTEKAPRVKDNNLVLIEQLSSPRHSQYGNGASPVGFPHSSAFTADPQVMSIICDCGG